MKTEPQIELLPCPFCGNQPKINRWGWDHVGTGCVLTGTAFNRDYRTPEQWNTRAKPTPEREQEQWCKEAKEFCVERLGVSPSEIPVDRVKTILFPYLHDQITTEAAQKLIAELKPYLRVTKPVFSGSSGSTPSSIPPATTNQPVKVSLEKCAKAIRDNDRADSAWDQIGEAEALRIAKTCAETWELQYVD